MTGSPSSTASQTPLVSVVVPTYNRIDRLRRVLNAFAEQTVDRDLFELIVVSDGSTDGTEEYLHSDELPLPVTAITQANSGPAAARNRGFEAAQADLVLFVDDDVLPAPNLVEEHLAAQANRTDTVVIGPMLTPDDHVMSPWVDWEQRMLYKQYDDMHNGVYAATARQFYTGNVSIERKHLVDSNGFDERFRRAEDVELAFRLDDTGVEFHFHPDAKGYHYAERGFEPWCDIAYAYGRNDVIFGRQPGRAWLLPFIATTFAKHHVVIRVVTRACVQSPRLASVVVAGLKRLVRFEAERPRQFVSRAALSIIYSIRYHQGVADELSEGANDGASHDGAERFRTLLRLS